MLSAGQVDAVTGFSYLSALNLKDRGIPADDIAVLRFADYGSSAYGAALIVNPKFAADKPEAIRAFISAFLTGLRQTIKQPGKAIDVVMTQINGGSRELELERLRAALNANIVTAEGRHNGFGGNHPGRLGRPLCHGRVRACSRCIPGQGGFEGGAAHGQLNEFAAGKSPAPTHAVQRARVCDAEGAELGCVVR